MAAPERECAKVLDLSIIIPTLNDEDAMRRQLQLIPRLVDPYAVEVIVVDGGSHDETLPLGAELGRVLHIPGNRATRLNAGAREARGEVMLFLSPDTLLPAEAVTAVRKAVRRRGVVGGCFRKQPYSRPFLLWLADVLTNLRMDLRLTLYGDRAVFVQRNVFLQSGGFDERLDVFDDVDLGRRLRRFGRLVQSSAVVRTSKRRFARGVPRTLFWMTAMEVGWRLGLDVSPIARRVRVPR